MSTISFTSMSPLLSSDSPANALVACIVFWLTISPGLFNKMLRSIELYYSRLSVNAICTRVNRARRSSPPLLKDKRVRNATSESANACVSTAFQTTTNPARRASLLVSPAHHPTVSRSRRFARPRWQFKLFTGAIAASRDTRDEFFVCSIIGLDGLRFPQTASRTSNRLGLVNCLQQGAPRCARL